MPRIEDEAGLFLQPPAEVFSAPVCLLGRAAVRNEQGVARPAHDHHHMATLVVVVLDQVADADLIPGGVIDPAPW